MSTLDEQEPDEVARRALEHARALIADAATPRGREERSTRRSFRRLFLDPSAVGVTITLTDQVMRFRSKTSAARALRSAVRSTTRQGFGLFNLLGLRAVALLSHVAPSIALSIVGSRVRALSANIILDAEPTGLSARFRAHRREGLLLNVNVLGEAVLGEREAKDRLERVLEMIERDDVNYVSVKLSSVVSQLLTIDRRGSLDRAAEKLRVLYLAAARSGTFVNLDMEEYRDLRLTLDAFMSVLAEAQFLSLEAGVVLQAYLPESHAALEELIAFASQRQRAGGARLKIRLVKGANLAMERVEAELHGWRAAPYDTKAEVDASYCALLDASLRPEVARGLRVGVASHNLFHVAWALELAAARDVADCVDVEMLEGMANAEARSLVDEGYPVLLYAPVTRNDDFAAAVAYLVRRLDENTAPENYLRAALFIGEDAEVFDEQRRRFLDALHARRAVSRAGRRHAALAATGQFSNEPDGDPTNEEYVESVTAALRDVLQRDVVDFDTLTHLDVAREGQFEEGHDPSDHGRTWYRYRVATIAEIDRALEFASSGFAHWHRLEVDERREILNRTAEVMSEERASSIAVMSRDGAKTVVEADAEVSEAIDFARFYASHACDDDLSTPLGVVLVVPPWNFPYAIPAGGVLAALAAGNAVILKPAPEAVAVSMVLARQLWRAGVPREVLQVVPTRDDECGRHLVTHVGVSAVVLTGSFETATLFTSWKPSLRLLAETSGKNAMVITASADIDLAVKDLVHSAFGHAGQKCSAASLAIVERSIYDDPFFRAQLIDAVTSLRVGASYDVSSNIAPIIRPPEPALRRALTSLEEGETWLVEPEGLDDEGLLWRPGVKVGVQPGSWSHRHEWFGPVLGIMVAGDLDEAIAWQNDTAYGLTAGVHSLDALECERWIERVEAGNLYVNRGVTGAVVRRQPFGGWKRSSVGPTAKAGGAHYVDALRHWDAASDVTAALAHASDWWRDTGSRALDESKLDAERNYVRYRRYSRPIAVRVDESITSEQIEYVRGLVDIANLVIDVSSSSLIKGLLDTTLESPDEMLLRADALAKVRWLSGEVAPTPDLLSHGLSVDPRPLAQAGAVELPRWLLEQSVTITNHRYGNLRAGPKPHCRGLAD